jgi:uncharacterized protein YcfL
MRTMRVFLTAAIASLLLAPCASAERLTGKAASVASSVAPSLDLSAAKKKAPKVEYMRSAAGPEPKATTKKKNK